jgi:hypothetical protein
MFRFFSFHRLSEEVAQRWLASHAPVARSFEVSGREQLIAELSIVDACASLSSYKLHYPMRGISIER